MRTAEATADGVVHTLSPRELQVLELAAQGMTNGEIAAQLMVALSTVKTHINHICRKLDVTNRTSAAAKARRLVGWLTYTVEWPRSSTLYPPFDGCACAHQVLH